MTEVSHQPCPSCGSSDAYSYNTSKEVGYCFSCGASNSNKKGNAVSLEAVNEYTSQRGIKPTTLEFYKCQDLYDSQGLVGHRYNYPQGYKQRLYPKQFNTSQGFSAAQLFGMNLFNGGGNEVLITEGELDAMSAYQMLNGQTPCVSLPSATPSHKLWQDESVIKFLRSFNRIYVSFDSDGKSDNVRDKLIALFPNKVYEIIHTLHKDANEFLTSGYKESYVTAKRNAQKCMADFLWNTSQDFVEILKEDHADHAVPTGIAELDNRIEGLIRGYLYVIQAPEGTGKQLPNTTLLPTPSGFKTMGSIQVGDTLFDEKGKPTKVTFVTETQYDVPCYEIVFADGTKQVAGGPHKWGVYTTDNVYKVKTTEEMVQEGVTRGEGVALYSVPICGPVEYPEKDLPIDPYHLGLWLGDGHSYSRGIIVGYDDAEEFESRAQWVRKKEYPSGINYWVEPVTHKKLNVLGLLKNKHIPDVYKTASIYQREELLRGMMDTDGGAAQTGCEFYTSSRVLMEDFTELARSLGFKCRVREKQSKLYGVHHKIAYTVWFLAYDNREVFKYKRKQSKVVQCNTFRATRKTIRSIKPVPSVPSRCLTVDTPSHLFLCGEHFTVTHNSEVIRYVEHQVITTQPDTSIAVMHMEESRQRYLLGLASYMLKTNVTRKANVSPELWPDVERVIKEIGDKGNLWLFEMSESADPSDIIERIRYMAIGLGVKYIFFEPIQDLAVNRQDNQSEEQFLSWLATKLALLATELNIGIITVAHENDDGLVRSCRMISKRAGVVLRLKRDKDAEEHLKNVSGIIIEKNRPTGYRGYGGALRFNPDTFTLEEAILDEDVFAKKKG